MIYQELSYIFFWRHGSQICSARRIHMKSSTWFHHVGRKASCRTFCFSAIVLHPAKGWCEWIDQRSAWLSGSGCDDSRENSSSFCRRFLQTEGNGQVSTEVTVFFEEQMLFHIGTYLLILQVSKKLLLVLLLLSNGTFLLSIVVGKQARARMARCIVNIEYALCHLGYFVITHASSFFVWVGELIADPSALSRFGFLNFFTIQTDFPPVCTNRLVGSYCGHSMMMKRGRFEKQMSFQIGRITVLGHIASLEKLLLLSKGSAEAQTLRLRREPVWLSSAE